MGRIAEALRKAESERAEKVRLRGEPTRYLAPPRRKFSSAPTGANEPSNKGTGGTSPAGIAAATQRSAGPAEPLIHAAAPRIVMPGTTAAGDHRVVCLSDPSSAIAEQYRAVRTWLLRHNAAGEHRSIAVTSAYPQEGKSVTTVNFAVALAEVRHLNVLMVDADLRCGSLARLTGMPRQPGLSDVLQGRATLADAVQKINAGNLSLMSAGAWSGGSPAELLSSRTAQALFDEVRERFHYVLVDTPPVQTASDVGVIGGMCTGVIMVVRMHRTPEPVVRHSVRWLQANNLHVLGCILTAANVRKSRLSYPYHYRNQEPATV